MKDAIKDQEERQALHKRPNKYKKIEEKTVCLGTLVFISRATYERLVIIRETHTERVGKNKVEENIV